MPNYKLRLELRKDRPDRQGLCQLRIKATINGIRKFTDTGIKLKAADWNDEIQCVVHTHKNAAQLNFKLSDLRQTYERELLDIERITGTVTSSKLEKVLQKKDMFDFQEYAANYFKVFKQQFKEETLETYGHDLRKLAEFQKKISFADLTPEFIARYHTFLKEVRGNSNNTCNKALKPIKKVLRYARDVDHLIKDDPFKVYNIGKVQTVPTYLTTDEIEKIWDICVNETIELYPSLRHTGLYFLLSCYTGLRYSDLQQIHKEGVIKDGRVNLVMVKGQDPLSLPLLTRAQTLIKLIGNKHILSNTKGNNYLKVLQEHAEITKTLHWHVGRHTMAMLLSDMGFDKDITAVLLGHRSIKSTSVYHRISKSRGIKEVENLQKKLDEIGHK